MNKNKRIKIGVVLLALLILFPVVAFGAQVDTGKEDKNNVPASNAFEQASRYMDLVVRNGMPGLEDWQGATINPEPVVLYDINGEKLFYEFSVEKNTKMVGRMKVCANKVLGSPVQTFEIGPRLWNPEEAIQKSIEVANNDYPSGKIKTTKLVVYNYHSVGAMTVVQDKTTGETHRIIVDATTNEIIPDKAPTETEEGVISIYNQLPKEKKVQNIAKWENSIEINTITPMMTFTKTLDVPLHGQITSLACAVATAQMIGEYYDVDNSQEDIMCIMGCGMESGCSLDQQLDYYKSDDGLGKAGTHSHSSPSFYQSVNEIDNNRPLVSGTPGHARAMKGYWYLVNSPGAEYILINDPAPLGVGESKWESWDVIDRENDQHVID